MPELLPFFDGTVDLEHQEAVDAGDHFGGEVSLPGERLGSGQRINLLTDGRDARESRKKRASQRQTQCSGWMTEAEHAGRLVRAGEIHNLFSGWIFGCPWLPRVDPRKSGIVAADVRRL